MKNNQIHEISHLFMNHYIKSHEIVIDMTMGNGLDTLHLSKLAKHVYAFDIQEKALVETKKVLELNQIKNVTLIKDSHANFLTYVKDFHYVVFNLGYLPKGDKNITTTKEDTIKALDLVLNRLPKLGCVQLMVYRGHPNGMEEASELDNYLKTLSKHDFKIVITSLPYQDNSPPYIIWIQKIKKDGK